MSENTTALATGNEAPASEKKEPNPLVGVASASEVLAAEKKAAEAEAKSQMIDSSPHMLALEKYLEGIFEDARAYKEDETDIQKTMLDNLRRRNGEYSEDKLEKIRKAGSAETYLPLTGLKCRAIEAFIHEIYLNAKRKRTWNLKPTPVPTISNEDKENIVEMVKARIAAIQAETGKEIDPVQAYQMASDMRAEIIQREYDVAQDKAENMSRLVDDQLTEGGWEDSISEGISDLSTFPAVIIKGPTLRTRKVKSGWKDGKIQYDKKTVPTFERVSPLDLYPSRYSKHPNDGTPICEKLSIQRSSLVENRDKADYIKENIEFVAGHRELPAARMVNAGLASEREGAENRENHETATVSAHGTTGSTFEAIEFYCSVRGADLISFGTLKDANGKKIDPILDYEINAITIEGKVVFLRFNTDPLKRRPYSVAGFAKEIGGFWYKAPPQLLKDVQDIVNAAARAMVNNLSWASGPQVIINDVNRLAPGEDITSIFVGKIWQGINSGNGAGSKLVEFFQPESRAAELIRVIDEFIGLADQVIEMPAYNYGSDKVSGAGRTSSGLSMLMSSSNRGIKRVVLDLDRNVFRNAISQVVDWNLENSDDDSIKGDMNFSSEGVVAMIVREQLSNQRMQFLQSTQNEFDMKVLGIDGRAKILADALETLESDYDDIKPTEAKIQRLLEREDQLQQQQIRENEMKIREQEALVEREAAVAQAEVELKMQELEVKKRAQDLEFKNKERELDIRAEKQSGDRIAKFQDQEQKRIESGQKSKEEPANA
jgi:hypothetical protein